MKLKNFSMMLFASVVVLNSLVSMKISAQGLQNGFDGKNSQVQIYEPHKIEIKRSFIKEIEFNVGFGSVNYNIEGKSGFDINSESRIGYYAGLYFDIPYVNLGLIYSEKKSLIRTSQLEKEIINRYFIIPVNYEVSIGTSNFALVLTPGVYGGFLLSTNEDEVLPLKNFDLGFDIKFFAEQRLSQKTLLTAGIRYERGGLNNLGSNAQIDKITSSVFYFFGGLKLIL